MQECIYVSGRVPHHQVCTQSGRQACDQGDMGEVRRAENRDHWIYSGKGTILNQENFFLAN